MAMNKNESWLEGWVVSFLFRFVIFLHLKQTGLFICFVPMAESQLRVVTAGFVPPACFLKTLRTARVVRLNLYCFVTGVKRV